MNAGRGTERLIADWFVEEAAVHSPDRVLTETRRIVLTTSQRRFTADWRESVYMSPLRLTAIAAALAVVLIGGAYLGRITAPSGPAAQPSASPTTAPSGSGVTLDSYRAARDAICGGYRATVDPLKDQVDGIYEAATSAAERAAKTQVLLEIVTQLEAMVGELDDLEAPQALAEGHSAFVHRYQDMNLFIREVLQRLGAGDLDGAATVDEAVNVLNDPMLRFEDDNGLLNCP